MKGKPVLTVVCSENKRKCGYLFTAIHRVPARLHEKRSHHATNTLITVWCWVPWRQMKNVWELSCVQIVLCGLPLFRWLFVVCRGSGEQVWQCCFFLFQTPPVLALCWLLVKSLTRVVFLPFWAPSVCFNRDQGFQGLSNQTLVLHLQPWVFLVWSLPHQHYWGSCVFKSLLFE